MQRNQWSFSYTQAELVQTITQHMDECQTHMEELRPLVAIQQQERQQLQEQAKALGASMQAGSHRSSEEAKLEKLQRKYNGLARYRRTLEREPASRQFKLHIDDVEFFEL